MRFYVNITERPLAPTHGTVKEPRGTTPGG
jgi:hypothetical protein